MTSLGPNRRMALPSIAAWLENPWPFADPNAMRIEESTRDGRYVVRAELPGFDAEKHIAVTANGGQLTITAEREAGEDTNQAGHHRSEFHYGTFSRTVSLAAGADSSKMSARYADGILEVSMPQAEHPRDRQVKIDVARD